MWHTKSAGCHHFNYDVVNLTMMTSCDHTILIFSYFAVSLKQGREGKPLNGRFCRWGEGVFIQVIVYFDFMHTCMALF